MLDDLKIIHDRDAQDALGIAQKQYQQLAQEFVIELNNFNCEQVILAGMGGSALAALVAHSWPSLNVPFEIVRDYEIPGYVSDKTLFIASSYSGNTEETLSALALAEAKNARIVVMSSGGKLAEIAAEKNYPLLKLPEGYQPRHATLFGLKALVTLFDACGLTENKASELSALGDWLKDAMSSWLPEVPTTKNEAKQIAQEIIGKSVVVYSGPKLFPAAYKWKISFNENAKHVAWVNQYPEFNHNEFIGWTKQPVEKPYAVIDLRSNLEHERIQKRFVVSERLLSGMRPAPIVVQAEGEDLLKQLLWTIALGDFVSLYVALLNGLNPTPVALIEKLKVELG